MIEVLFLTSNLQQYRIPILNIIGADNEIKLTVAHSSKQLRKSSDNFEEVILKEKMVGPISYHGAGFIDFCKKFDVIVSMFYVQKLSLMSLLFHKEHFKIIYWGIGVRASQKNKFDSPSWINKLRYYVAKRSDAMIFYTQYAKNKYIFKGINSEKLFVMPNTVMVLNEDDKEVNKDCITLIGSLNKSKNIFVLLEAYLFVYKEVNSLPNLEIIGNGDDFNAVHDWIKKHQLESKIILHGSIYDDEMKSNILKRSLVNISPSQAGLSVLECFGYGVPFATSKYAYTGGERLNVVHNENGFLLNDDNLIREIQDIIFLTVNNKDMIVDMGRKAKFYYEEYRTPEIMAKGFLDAVNYVLK